jgi:hypothetical protein
MRDLDINFNIKLDFKEIECDNLDTTELAENRL